MTIFYLQLEEREQKRKEEKDHRQKEERIEEERFRKQQDVERKRLEEEFRKQKEKEVCKSLLTKLPFNYIKIIMATYFCCFKVQIAMLLESIYSIIIKFNVRLNVGLSH